MANRKADDTVDPTALPPSRDLAGVLPESLTIAIDLPAEVAPDAPEHELAVAIHTDAVDPGELAPATMSIKVKPVLSLPTVEEEPVELIPPLPSRPIAKRRTLPGRPAQPIEPQELAPEVEPEPEPEPDPVEETLDGALRPRKRTKKPKAKKVKKAKKEPRQRRDRGPEPEGALQLELYRSTFGLVNVGDSLRVRQRKELDARIAAPLATKVGFVPVISRKGGVGTTTVTALLGMALANVRDDRVLAIDGHPDRGTLASRVSAGVRSSVRDVVTHSASINSINDFAAYVARDDTRLDVIASEHGPSLGLGFDQGDFTVLAGIATKYYGFAVTDAGAGVTHSVLRALLAKASGIVVVTGGALDEAEITSETLSWLDAKGYDEQVRDAVVVINTATVGTDVRDLDQLRAHFAARVRDVVILPYDPTLAAGAVIEYDRLNEHTREAARDLAAAVVDGLALVPEPEDLAAPEDSTDR